MLPQSDRFDLFATRVWVFRLDHLRARFDSWTAAIAQWQAATGTQGSSNRGGWTSPKTVLDRPEFAELAAAARACFDAAWAECKPSAPPDYWLRGWVNLQEPGGFNHFHMHGRAALAGVFYLDVPEGSGDIMLRDPRGAINVNGIKGDGVNCFATASHSPAAGQFVVFPGWLEHGVDVNRGNRARVSIPINCYCDQTQIA